ncbi:Protein anon-37Cs [Nymphon striatum]|nr:Protein anon-37Cs [Nymphon striatum]
MSYSAKIVIVGGGVAGLFSAYLLQKNGFKNIIILEARDRVGGRIHTVTHGTKKLFMGAEYLHISNARPNIAYELLKNNCNEIYNENDTVLQDFSHRGFSVSSKFSSMINTIWKEVSLSYDESLAAIDGDVEFALEENKYKSLGEKLSETYKKIRDGFEGYSNAEKMFADALFNAALRIISDNEGEDSFKISALLFGIPSKDTLDEFVTPKNGFGQLTDVLQSGIGSDCIKLNEPVTKICFTEETNDVNSVITVCTESMSSYEADHVIVTLPVGVLQETYSTMFEPTLPDRKQKAIKYINPGSYFKIFFQFDDEIIKYLPSLSYAPVWLDDPDDQKSSKDLSEENFFHSVDKTWNRGISNISFDSDKNLGTASIIGKAARYAETLSDEELLDGLFKCLKSTLRIALTITKPELIGRTSWMSDPYCRGAFSSLSPRCDSEFILTKDLAAPILDKKKVARILFAGEATSTTAIATVHGAMETATRETERLISYYQIKNSQLS